MTPEYYYDLKEELYKKSNNNSNNSRNKAVQNKVARELYRAYHYDKALRSNGEQPLILDASKDYIKACKLAQKALHKKVHCRGITIEVNPTSNKKISAINEYRDLPMWNFNSYGITKNINGMNCKREDLQISINTDDSAIFETNLTNEYSCIALSLLKEQCGMEEVIEFIKYISGLSRQTTFLDIQSELQESLCERE